MRQRTVEKIENLNTERERKQRIIDNGEASEKRVRRLENQISELDQRVSLLQRSINDIDLLSSDNRTYALRNINGGEHHVVLGDNDVIYIETSSNAISLHEISHIRQSLNGRGLIFDNRRLVNNGTTRNSISANEIEAYKIQYSYDTSFPGGGGTLNGITIQSVGNIRNDRGEFVYPIINDYARELARTRRR